MKIVSILFALVLAVCLVMPAAVAAADPKGLAGLDKCEWDKVKWAEWPKKNENSWHLYLQHWGRTPIQAMARLSGLCSPDMWCKQAMATSCPDPKKSKIYGDPNVCLGGCPACRSGKDADPGALATCSDPAVCEKSLTESACALTGQAAKGYDCPDGRAMAQFQPSCGFCWGKSLAYAAKSWAGADIGKHPRINNNHLNHFGTNDCYGGNKGGDWGISGSPHTECCALAWALQDNCFVQPYKDTCAPR